MNKYVLDASALLTVMNDEPGCQIVSDYLPNACMSTVNQSEVAAILYQLQIPESDIRNMIDSLITDIIPFDDQQAYQAAKLRKHTKDQGLSLGDRACLALGLQKKLPVVTADKAWSKLDLNLKIILIR